MGRSPDLATASHSPCGDVTGSGLLFYICGSVQLIWGVLDKHSLILIAAFLGPLGIPGELTL